MLPTPTALRTKSVRIRPEKGHSPFTLARTTIGLALLCALWSAGLAFAQTGARYDGLQIVEVQFEGLESLSQDTVEHYLLGVDSGEGRRLDRAELNDRVEKLWKRELIDDIKVSVEAVTGGVKLNIRLVERPILTSVEYVGIKRVNRTDISEAADRERVSVYESQPLQRGELERLKRVIEELYKEKGYRFAQVRFVLEDSGTGQRRVTYTIDEGDKVKIGDIEFDGNTIYGDWRLRLVMKDTKKSNLISRITKKDIYNPATIEEDLDKVRELYRKAGYKDVLIAKPEIDVVARRPQAATIADQKRRLAVTVPIEEGERWKFGEVSIEGNEVFSDELLLAQFEKPRGGWLRSKVVDDAVETISKLYSSIGYIFASVDAELVEGTGNVADVVVHVDEADQFRVGRIEFEGNTKTQDKVLRRELLVQEGRVMNMTAVQNSLLKIRQLNYFAIDEEEPVAFDFDAEDKKVDLLIKGEEAERTELQFGGGWSEVDGFFGQFSLRTTNFLGRGETVGVSFQSGRQREFYDLEYRIPWFLDRPQSIGFRLFSQEFDSDVLTGVEFQQSFSGASVTYGRSFRGFQSFSLTYSFADVEDTRTLVDPETGELRTSESNFKTSTLRPFWIRNTLDSRFEPTRGIRASGSIDIAGGFLGGESEYIRPEFEMTWFRPVSRQPFKSYFGVNFEAGYIEPIGDPAPTDPKIFPQQRFFLGGDNSIRGFSRRSVVVRNEDGTIRRDSSNFPAGGSTSLLLNLEYHIQAGGPFRVVLFADAGGVFDTRGEFGPSQDIDPDLFRYSAGVELRVKVPIFPAPLRFIYASNIDPLPNDQFDSFDFSLSTAF